jgi:hypothetical protein
MKRGLFTVYQRDLGPECFGTVATPIAGMKRNDLACLRVHGDPDPLPVGLLLHKTPHLIGLSFQLSYHHGGWMTWDPDMEVIGADSKAFHHTVQEPRQTDAHDTADPTQRDALAQRVFNHGALLVPDATVFARGHNLALARFTLMILLCMAGMAIFLLSDRSTVWARLPDDHGCW